MGEALIKLCAEMISILRKLRDEGKITQDEYEKHVDLKIKYMDKYLENGTESFTISE